VIVINYYLKENVNDFGLRRPFYSRQGLKNTCCSPVYTSHKRTKSTELILINILNMSTRDYYTY